MNNSGDLTNEEIDAILDSASRQAVSPTLADASGILVASTDEPATLDAASAEDAGILVASTDPALANAFGILVASTNQPPAPNAALAQLLSEGFVPQPRAASGPTLGWRIKMVASTAVAKLAALSVVGKAAAASTAVAVAASGVGAVGVLPVPAQDRFDAIVHRGPAPVESPLPVAPSEEPSEGGTEDESFGQRVSGDATGEDDGTKGVDGAQISTEASDGKSRAGGNFEDKGRSDDAEGKGKSEAKATEKPDDTSDDADDCGDREVDAQRDDGSEPGETADSDCDDQDDAHQDDRDEDDADQDDRDEDDADRDDRDDQDDAEKDGQDDRDEANADRDEAKADRDARDED